MRSAPWVACLTCSSRSARRGRAQPRGPRATEQLAGDLKVEDVTAPLPVTDLISSRSVETTVPIILGGQRVGSLRLIVDTRDLLCGAFSKRRAGRCWARAWRCSRA